MNNIAGIPYTAARFDKDGAALDKQEVTLPESTTDVIVASHGWNNTEEQAEQLYIPLFTNFAAVASDQLHEKKIAIVGVIWPSKKFTDVVDAAVAEQAPRRRTKPSRPSSTSLPQCSTRKRRKRSPLRRTRLASWRVISMHGENL